MSGIIRALESLDYAAVAGALFSLKKTSYTECKQALKEVYFNGR